jgi:choline-sulfatase
VRRGPVALATALVALVLAAVCARRSGSAAAPPVVLISIDTLRADRLPAYGYRGVRTPALDALAHDSIVFENAYCSAPLTLPSHTTLLTGLLPSQHGVRDNVGYRLAPTHPTLATALKGRGYATGAAVSTFALRRDRGLAAGFDGYDDQFGAASPDERPGSETARVLERFADANPGRPLFLFLHLYEPHTPYLPPEPFRTEYASRPYDGEIAAADAAVGGFLAHLKKIGVYDRAVIVLLSDHGEGLGDHGEDEHGVFLYRETIRVPLFVKLPGSRRAASRIRAPVGLIDIFPTITETAGFAPVAGLPGVSLARLADGPGTKPRRIYSETLYPRLQLGWSDLASLTDDRFSYIEAPRPELYDIVADPAEKRDLAASRPPALRSMRAELLSVRDSAASPEKSSAEELEKLGSLGYIRVDPGSAGKRNLPDPKDRISELRQYKRLFDLFYAHRDDESIALAREMLAANPQILSVSRMLATSLERKGNAAEAAAVLEGALSRGDRTGSAEDVVQTAEELATLLSRSPDAARSEKSLTDLVKRGVAGEPVRRELARLLHRRGRPAEALALLGNAGASTDPATLDVYGAVLADSGRPDDARRAFARALEIEPGRADVLLHLGMLSLRLKDPARAREWFSKSLAADPAAPGTLAALGLAQAQLGDNRAALESWDRALVLDPRQFDTLFNRAVLAGRTGDTAAARRGLEQFIATAPAGRYGGQIAEARRLLKAMAMAAGQS